MIPLNTRLLARRTVLKAAGVSLTLPLLDAMLPGGRHAEAAIATTAPQRLVTIGRPLGLHGPHLFPTKTGFDYEETRYLKHLAAHRKQMTIISGMSHPSYSASHDSELAIFTGAPWEIFKNPKDRRNTVSVDQVARELVADKTRFPSLVLGSQNVSWNRKGIRVPQEGNPESVFRKLFIDAKPEETKRILRDLEDGRSIMDRVRDQARSLNKTLGGADREKLEQYFSSIREAEVRLKQNEAWATKPKPKIEATIPKSLGDERYLIERSNQWFDIVHLALQTDSTRVVALWLHGHSNIYLDGKLTEHHHDLSHHGQDETKIAKLGQIEDAEVKCFARFLDKLHGSEEQGGTLLNNTMAFYTSNLSNANSHSNSNLPAIVAGGRMKHGQHLAYDQKNNRPLSDLYLTMLQKFGVETDSFGTSRGVVAELV